MALVVFLLAGSAAHASAVLSAWTGAGADDLWITADNWAAGTPPLGTETVSFDNTGASTLPGEVTNVLSGNVTIGGLTFRNDNRYHTTDFGGNTLTVEGDLNFNVNYNKPTTTTLTDGTLQVVGPSANVNVGRSYSGGAWAKVDMTGLSQFTATDVGEFHVGTRVSGSAFGDFSLAESNLIEADQFVVGDHASANLHLGQSNTLRVGEMLVGGSYSNARVDIVSGGTLRLGTAEKPTSLRVGDGVINTNSTYMGTIDLSTGAVEAYIDHLVIGRKSNNPGNQRATVLGGDSGSISVGRPGNTSNMIVGYRASAEADFAAMDGFTANLDQLIVGRSGSATLRLSETVDIDAREIVVAESSGSTLALGLHNTILVDQMLVGGSYGNGTVTVRSGGTTQLGSPERPVSLTVGKGTINTNSTYTGKLDLSQTTLNAHIDHLIVGEKDNMPGNQKAVFLGGDGGSVSIGAADARANMTVGYRASGEVDFSAMDSCTAHLNKMAVGRGGGATVKLPSVNFIDAREVFVGDGTSGTLALGDDNTLLVDDLWVGGSYSNSKLTVRSNSATTLGAPERRTTLTIGKASTNTNSTYNSTVDFTNATVEAWFEHVLVGEKNNMPGGQRGYLLISDRDDNYINVHTMIVGGAKATGIVDFSGGTLAGGSIERGPGSGAFNWYGGTLSVDAFGSPSRSFDLKNTGDGTLAPGEDIGATVVVGKYTQGFAATAEMQLGGTLPGTRYDQLDVYGTAQLDGTLDVLLFNGFAPSPTDTFDVVTATAVSGQFANAPAGSAALSTPFGTFDVAYATDKVTLSNFVPDPVAPAASIGFLNAHAGEVLGGSAVIGGVDAAFGDNQQGILGAQYDAIDGAQLEGLIGSGLVDFDEPNFALPGDVMQVWDLDFQGDDLGPGGIDLVFGYDDTGLSPTEEAALDIYHYDGGQWTPMFGTVDVGLNTITINTTSLSPFAVGAVPEPSTLALAVIGLAGLAAYARRRREG